MKAHKLIFTAVIILFSTTVGEADDLGEMLMRIAEGIKYEAFNDAFKQRQYSWTVDNKQLNEADMSDSKYQVASLINGLKNHVIEGELKEELLGKLAIAESEYEMARILGSLIILIDESYLTANLASVKDSILEGDRALNNPI